MDQQLARELLLIVNDQYGMDMLKKYALYRIEQLRKQLDNVTDTVELHRVQGQIKELKRFDTLREEVVNASK